MKTYADLTDEQLKELFRLLFGRYNSRRMDDKDIRTTITTTISGTEHVSVEWDNGSTYLWLWLKDDGSFSCNYAEPLETPGVIWQVIALLKSWGVDYTPAP